MLFPFFQILNAYQMILMRLNLNIEYTSSLCFLNLHAQIALAILCAEGEGLPT